MVKTGQVTYAVRDTVIDDKEIKQDDFMGIGDSRYSFRRTEFRADGYGYDETVSR